MTAGSAPATLISMSAHRTIRGSWAECPALGVCELLFHVELSVAEANAVPLATLLPLLNAVDPAPDSTSNGYMRWVDAKSRLHRGYGLPALVDPEGIYLYTWFKHGRRHRPGDRPAVILADGGLQWWVDDLPHRDGDKPASVYPDGSRQWWVNGVQHRVGAPAELWSPAATNRGAWLARWHENGRLLSEEYVEQPNPEWFEAHP